MAKPKWIGGEGKGAWNAKEDNSISKGIRLEDICEGDRYVTRVGYGIKVIGMNHTTVRCVITYVPNDVAIGACTANIGDEWNWKLQGGVLKFCGFENQQGWHVTSISPPTPRPIRPKPVPKSDSTNYSKIGSYYKTEGGVTLRRVEDSYGSHYYEIIRKGGYCDVGKKEGSRYCLLKNADGYDEGGGYGSSWNITAEISREEAEAAAPEVVVTNNHDYNVNVLLYRRK